MTYNKYKGLMERIARVQEIARTQDEDNLLTESVQVNGLGIHFRESYCDSRQGVTLSERFAQYARELEENVSYNEL